MKTKVPKILEESRLKSGAYGSDRSYGWNGVFQFKKKGWYYRLMISDQKGWDHVSVSILNAKTGTYRMPNWREMCMIKDLCFDPDEVAMQLHPAASDYVNDHEFVLHLWRPHQGSIPLPPFIMV